MALPCPYPHVAHGRFLPDLFFLDAHFLMAKSTFRFFMTKSRPLPVVVGELAVADDVNDDGDAEHDVDVGYFAEEPFWDKMIL